jgi:hypothetical protein
MTQDASTRELGVDDLLQFFCFAGISSAPAFLGKMQYSMKSLLVLLDFPLVFTSGQVH